MTLLDAPVYDERRDHRRRVTLASAAGLLLVLFVGGWLVAGRPVDWPWNWDTHLRGRMTVNAFFTAIEKKDLPAAYGIWTHDKDWQQHPAQHASYTFDRFEKDWSATSPDNDYGQIRSHRVAATRIIGNILQTGTFVNGRKSQAINLDYDPKTRTLNFSPEDVQFLEGPGGIS